MWHFTSKSHLSRKIATKHSVHIYGFQKIPSCTGGSTSESLHLVRVSFHWLSHDAPAEGIPICGCDKGGYNPSEFN